VTAMQRQVRKAKPAPQAHQFSPSNRFLKRIPEIHTSVDDMSQALVFEVWSDKYRWRDESNTRATFARVVQAVYQHDDSTHAQEAYEAMCAGLWMPGGRIIAGAGTTKRVTLMNCYVNKKIEDSLDDIMHGVSIAALTQQQGGGIGTDFSTLRPSGAILHRTGARASGPLPFMDMWHAMCSTIMSAGDRRGAMMGTISDTHPDLPKFITAKQEPNRLTNFNVSVLVSDAFMAAVQDDAEWVLHFNVEPAGERDLALREMDFVDDDNVTQYVYEVWPARKLWALITKNTYEWSEPGVIFIDRINELNNLQYCEYIHCTNPCGEQPLPPNGTCNLGAVNLSRVVTNPFTETAEVNWPLLSDVVRVGVRFLDNVIDITNYPLPEQKEEELAKRRLGLGVSGLADCLAQLGLRYVSAQAVSVTEKIFQVICTTAYEASIDLGHERGSFPLFNLEKFVTGDSFAAKNLQTYHKSISLNGIRNGVLMTVAPTGTTSILYGNVSAGIEPVFAHQSVRKVRQADNSFKEYTSYGYSFLLYAAHVGKQPGEFNLPAHMVEAKDLSIDDHVVIQAAVQRWVDASVSKTINVSESTSYEQFEKVYHLAYALGCKGCTTYRPSEVRGSILSRAGASNGRPSESLPTRSEILRGITHKVKWPSMSSALYITVNQDEEGKPFEVFFNSKDARYIEWMTALSLMISAILRKSNGDATFIGEELGAVHSVHDTAWIHIPGEDKPKHFGSLIAYIGYILGSDFSALSDVGAPEVRSGPVPTPLSVSRAETCPSCLAPALTSSEGCKTCANCGYSDCA